jgi:hypothetical protein
MKASTELILAAGVFAAGFGIVDLISGSGLRWQMVQAGALTGVLVFLARFVDGEGLHDQPWEKEVAALEDRVAKLERRP